MSIANGNGPNWATQWVPIRSDGNGGIQVDKVTVYIKQTSPCVLIFSFVGPALAGFTFADPPIVFKTENDQFPPPSRTIKNNALAVVFNHATKTGQFEYSINYLDASGHPHTLDPMVENNGGP